MAAPPIPNVAAPIAAVLIDPTNVTYVFGGPTNTILNVPNTTAPIAVLWVNPAAGYQG